MADERKLQLSITVNREEIDELDKAIEIAQGEGFDYDITYRVRDALEQAKILIRW